MHAVEKSRLGREGFSTLSLSGTSRKPLIVRGGRGNLPWISGARSDVAHASACSVGTRADAPARRECQACTLKRAPRNFPRPMNSDASRC